MERKETRMHKTILKKEQSQRIHITHTQFEDNIISYNNQDSMWYWGKDKHIDQWNKIGNPETDLYQYSQPFLAQYKRQFSRKRTAFSTNGGRKIRIPYAKQQQNLNTNQDIFKHMSIAGPHAEHQLGLTGKVRDSERDWQAKKTLNMWVPTLTIFCV